MTEPWFRPSPSTEPPATPGPAAAPGEPGDPGSGRSASPMLGIAAGIVSGALGLGVAEIVAGVVAPASAPLVALGDVVVDQVPPWLKDFAVSNFGTHDKQVLLGTALVVALLLSALAGVISTGGFGPRARRYGPGVVLALGALAALAAATRPDAGMLAVVPSVLGALAGMFALSKLAPLVVYAGRVQPESLAGTESRRRVLLGLGGVLAAGVVLGGLGRVLSKKFRGAAESRADVVLPKPADPAPALPAGVDVGVKGVTPFLTPNDQFYRIDTALIVPQLRAEDWELRIHGLVEREVTLTWAQLLASPLVERDVTLMCVSNEVGGDLTSNARWLGLPIKGLLERAAPKAGADMVLSKSSDGWTAGTPLDVLLDGRDALLAIGMNGEPLPVEHGFPVRVVVPGLYGYVSATKWVVDLEVTSFDRAEGYWTPRGWSAKGPVKTESRIDVPHDGDQVKAGVVTVAGIAWHEHVGVSGVEVRVDDGEWQKATLGAEDSIDTWRQWFYRWTAPAGQYRLQVRAVDRAGAVQTAQEAPPAPDGASGYHTISVSVG